jgi:hypothetical protein
MTDHVRATAYVGLFWEDLSQDVTHAICSLERRSVVSAAADFLIAADVPQPNYETFLLRRLQEWDGAGIQVTTLDHGKLALFATELQNAGATPTLRRIAQR